MRRGAVHAYSVVPTQITTLGLDGATTACLCATGARCLTGACLGVHENMVMRNAADASSTSQVFACRLMRGLGRRTIMQSAGSGTFTANLPWVCFRGAGPRDRLRLGRGLIPGTSDARSDFPVARAVRDIQLCEQ